MAVQRITVDLSAYPDLVVIYLGMKAHNAQGARALQNLGPQIAASVAAQPDGLLHHEMLAFSVEPPSGMFRQYWRDFASLEAWTRTLPHLEWWQQFLRDPSGTEFWHEAYFLRGGMEGIFDNVQEPLGLLSFAPNQTAKGRMFSSRQRFGMEGEAVPVEGATESDLYPGGE